MEDISRELEREIARAKPSPHKTNRKKKVLVVNDFGEMSSGRYLSVLVRVLTVISLVFGVAASGLYYLYTSQSKKVANMEKQLVMLEKKKAQLTNDKEILMARLVLAGDKPVFGQDGGDKPIDKSGEIKTEKSQAKTAQQENLVNSQSAQDVAEEISPKPEEKEPLFADGGVGDDSGERSASDKSQENEAKAKPQQSNIIAVEDFSISQTPDHERLRVTFDIRNTKEGPGDITGRIFVVLKPEGGHKDEWIVAPKVSLAQDGLPSDYKRGQYFSISRFKPVKFTINSRILPERLKTTGIYIFDDEGQLIFKDMVETRLDEDE